RIGGLARIFCVGTPVASSRQSGRDDLILAISERLNLDKAGVRVDDVPAKVIWFKDKLVPKHVLKTLEESDREQT
ncbi:MAG: DUF790 family protein, partial [Cyanobacteria bacterium J06639_1]